MLQLNNTSPLKAAFFVFPNQRGIDTLYVVVKATFGLHPKVHLAEEQKPITLADEYWGEPGKSSLKYASEAHLEKPGTDLVVLGEACAPYEKPVPELDVGLSVANRVSGVKVFGDRKWKPFLFTASPSKPEPFVRMPLVYERAFGGMYLVDELTGEILSEPRNPVGKGFKGKRSINQLPEVGVPNIEDFRDPVRSPGDRPKPAGLGFIAPSWEPRLAFAGTYDDDWQKKRAPYLPADFDSRFFNNAHPDWIFDTALQVEKMEINLEKLQIW